MKLLLDHNLSPRLISALHDSYAGSVHVRTVGLHTASDDAVWSYAREHGFAIVSKDVDFHQRSLVLGAPPKFVWIQRGNCATNDILTLLQTQRTALLTFESDRDAAFLVLG